MKLDPALTAWEIDYQHVPHEDAPDAVRYTELTQFASNFDMPQLRQFFFDRDELGTRAAQYLVTGWAPRTRAEHLERMKARRWVMRK